MNRVRVRVRKSVVAKYNSFSGDVEFPPVHDFIKRPPMQETLLERGLLIYWVHTYMTPRKPIV